MAPPQINSRRLGLFRLYQWKFISNLQQVLIRFLAQKRLKMKYSRSRMFFLFGTSNPLNRRVTIGIIFAAFKKTHKDLVKLLFTSFVNIVMVN